MRRSRSKTTVPTKPNAFIYCLALSTHASFYSYSNTIISSLIMSMRWVCTVSNTGISSSHRSFLSHIPEPELCGGSLQGNIKAERSLLTYSNFVMMFLQLVAGLIERANNLVPVEAIATMRSPTGIFPLAFTGSFGAFQKPWWPIQQAYLLMPPIIITTSPGFDVIGWDRFIRHPDILVIFPVIRTWLLASPACLASGSREFCDPVFSKDITEFWRRWHMSLSSWLRDYLYISLAATGWENGRHTEPDADHAAWWLMARRLLELCDLGRHQRFISII